MVAGRVARDARTEHHAFRDSPGAASSPSRCPSRTAPWAPCSTGGSALDSRAQPDMASTMRVMHRKPLLSLLAAGGSRFGLKPLLLGCLALAAAGTVLVGACSSSQSTLGMYQTGCCADEPGAASIGIVSCPDNPSCDTGLACLVSNLTVMPTCLTPCCPPGQCSALYTDVKVCKSGEVCVLGNGALGYCATYIGPATAEEQASGNCGGGNDSCANSATGDTGLSCVEYTLPGSGAAAAACGHVQP